MRNAWDTQRTYPPPKWAYNPNKKQKLNQKVPEDPKKKENQMYAIMRKMMKDVLATERKGNTKEEHQEFKNDPPDQDSSVDLEEFDHLSVSDDEDS